MTQRWYQHRWLWFLIAIPACSVVLGIVMIVLAVRNPATLVVDNYYAEGRSINRSIALDEAAARRNIQATLQVNSDRVLLQLNADSQPMLEDALMLYVYHATDAERDHEFLLAPGYHPALSGQAVYEPVSEEDQLALLSVLDSDSSWYFEIRGADNTWRLRQRVITPAREFTF